LNHRLFVFVRELLKLPNKNLRNAHKERKKPLFTSYNIKETKQ